MRKWLIGALIVLGATTAHAQRPSTLVMGCGEAQALVARHGAAVLSTGRFTYERFVSDDRFCAAGEWTYRASAPTRDAANCPIGYRCSSIPPFFDDDNSFGPGGGLMGR